MRWKFAYRKKKKQHTVVGCGFVTLCFFVFLIGRAYTNIDSLSIDLRHNKSSFVLDQRIPADIQKYYSSNKAHKPSNWILKPTHGNKYSYPSDCGCCCAAALQHIWSCVIFLAYIMCALSLRRWATTLRTNVSHASELHSWLNTLLSSLFQVHVWRSLLYPRTYIECWHIYDIFNYP